MWQVDDVGRRRILVTSGEQVSSYGPNMQRELREDEWGRPINPGDILEMIVRSQEADPSEMGQPPNSVEHQRSEAAEETRRKPIISIHGRDIDEDEIDRAA
jgi:hypothetical protein